MAEEKKKSSIFSEIKVATWIKVFAVFIIVVVIVASKYIYEYKTDQFRDRLFKKIVDNNLKQIETIEKEKLNSSLVVATTLAKKNLVKKALLKYEYYSIISSKTQSAIERAIFNDKQNHSSLSSLLSGVQNLKEYGEIGAYLINNEGIVIKRSWSSKIGEDLVKENSKFEYYLKYPKTLSSIDFNKFGLGLSNKIPIYDDGKFLGYFATMLNLDALCSSFYDNGDGIVVLLDKEYSRKLYPKLSYTKKFIDDYYVANTNADSFYIRYIKEFGVDDFYHYDFKKGYFEDKKTSSLIFKYDFYNAYGDLIAKAFIFKDTTDIDFGELASLQRVHIVATILVILTIMFFTIYLIEQLDYKELEARVNELLFENKELSRIAEEEEFTEKKMLNLFDSQPNIMVIHNGKEVIQGNRRFMGFFNRFGSFEGFKEKHKCISELFEKFDDFVDEDYIYTQKIEGVYWIDYMLQNPRRPYKTVMSINGSPHYFYIKFNEMTYAKYGGERLIFLAFVDFTADFKKYKNCLSQIANQNKTTDTKEQESKTQAIKKPITRTITKKIVPKKVSTPTTTASSPTTKSDIKKQ